MAGALHGGLELDVAGVRSSVLSAAGGIDALSAKLAAAGLGDADLVLLNNVNPVFTLPEGVSDDYPRKYPSE